MELGLQHSDLNDTQSFQPTARHHSESLEMYMCMEWVVTSSPVQSARILDGQMPGGQT